MTTSRRVDPTILDNFYPLDEHYRHAFGRSSLRQHVLWRLVIGYLTGASLMAFIGAVIATAAGVKHAGVYAVVFLLLTLIGSGLVAVLGGSDDC